MASSDKDASCANDPNFAIICTFFEKFSENLQIKTPNLKDLQDWLNNSDEVTSGLKDLHIKLLRKTRKTVHETAWESALSKFCYTYSAQDAWELERFGYKKSSLKVKLRILRELLESQFERNAKFRSYISGLSAENLRDNPIGRDRLGHSYYVTQDPDCNLRVYQEHLDEEIWQVVATSREELVKLIARLRGNEVVLPAAIGVIDEDSSSNSCAATIAKAPPPEEKDESQDGIIETENGDKIENIKKEEEKIPNIKIKLGKKDESPEGECSENKEDQIDRKVKPLIISQTKISSEKTKKRGLSESDKREQDDFNVVKKQRPTLLDAKREKKASRYENLKDDSDEDDDDEEGEEEEEEEEQEDEDEEGDDGGDSEGDEEEEEDDEKDDNKITMKTSSKTATMEKTEAKRQMEMSKSEDEDFEDEELENANEQDEESKKQVPLKNRYTTSSIPGERKKNGRKQEVTRESVGEAIEEPVMLVKGLGCGSDCESPSNVDHSEISEEIAEEVFYVFGEGSGAECLVGNSKDDEPKATFFFGQPGCLKLSPVKKKSTIIDNSKSGKNDVKIDKSEKQDTSEVKLENGGSQVMPEHDNEEKNSLNLNVKAQISVSDNDELHTVNREKQSDEYQSGSDSKIEDTSSSSIVETSQITEKPAVTTGDPPETKENNESPTIISPASSSNRKRRLSVDNSENRPSNSRQPSESETDFNSENFEDNIPDNLSDEDDECNIGGKRPKIRSKIVNTEIRKKIEAQRQEGKVDDTSSSSEEERPRKKVAPKKDKNTHIKYNEKESEEEKSPHGIVAEDSNLELEKNDTLTSPLPEREEMPKATVGENQVSNAPHSRDLPKEAIPFKKRNNKDKTEDNTEKVKIEETQQSVVEVQTSELLEENENKPTVLKTDPDSEKPMTLEILPDDEKPVLDVKVSTRENIQTENTDKISLIDESASTDEKHETAKSPINGEPQPDSNSPATIAPQKKRTRTKVTPINSTLADNAQISPKGKKLKTEDIQEETKVEKREITEQTEPKKLKATTSQRTPRHLKEVDSNNIIDDSETPVRQSRRIAQLKIREEAERRKLEEVALKQMKDELKKKKKKENDPTVSPPPSEKDDDEDDDESETELRKKVEKTKKKKRTGGWSSGSEDVSEKETEEQFYGHYESDRDRGSPLFKSDHEFSPESDLEDESQVVPTKRARTVRKEGDEEVETEDLNEACMKCGKTDHPEWILLCDKCDKGYHCSCLSPVIFYIPEGDWFCPPCQQEQLILALEARLKEFDDLVLKRQLEEEEQLRRMEVERQTREREELERQLVKAEGKAKVRKSKNSRAIRRNRKRKSSEEDGSGNDSEAESQSGESSSASSRNSSSKSESSSASDSDDEPIYKLRKRRQINVSYRLNEYDDLIKSALKEEEDEVAGAGNLGRGKDISTIMEADREEKARQKQIDDDNDNGDGENERKKPKSSGKHMDDSGSDFEPMKTKSKLSRNSLKKKNRKLNSLDVSSEGDNDSDEDFKTSSFDDEDEEDQSLSVSTNSDSSLEEYRRRKNNGKKKTRRAARRAARERRKDRKFVVEDSDESEEDRPLVKKKRKEDSDYSESEGDVDDDDELSEDVDSEELCDDSSSSNDDGGWQPSKRKKQKTTAPKKAPSSKPKIYTKPKKKRVNENERSFKAGISKSRKILDEDDDSDDSGGRKTRGKRFTYLEDYEDDSSDGGIKPGVKRPDTPPEEREKFIKKQEEIKRMLAEKNTEAAKVVATPTLTPIKKTPEKLDSLSTVPLSVIRQAKVLDVDYLQRKGESISDVGEEDENDFGDDDLPEDFNPEDMDEDAIAKMMEEEDFAQQQLKLAGEAIRQKKLKETDTTFSRQSSYHVPQSTLQEPVRKKLPMPTIHPPLLRHSSPGGLLQNALSAPLGQPIPRGMPPGSSNALSTQTEQQAADQKPKGRRKKITPLRDPLQKQQAAAAASAAAVSGSSSTPASSTSAPLNLKDVSKPEQKPSLSVAQPPQLYKPPQSTGNQPSVITRMPHIPVRQPPGSYVPEQGSRFYAPLPNQIMGHRPPLRHGVPNMPQMTPHHTLRPTYATGPPPLRPGVPSGPPPRIPYNPAEQYGARARHGAPLLNPYRPQLYGNPGFAPGPLSTQPQPNSIRVGSAPDFPPPAPYSYYPPPPIGVPHSTPPPPTAAVVPSSVIVSANSRPHTNIAPAFNNKHPSVHITPAPPPPDMLKLTKLTTLETFNSKSIPAPSLTETESRGSYSSNPPPDDNEPADSLSPPPTEQTTSEFSGLVSYFSSQHDDLNT